MKSAVRIENDSFGELELPSDCLYGVRTARCIGNTSVGSAPLSAYPELIRALSVVKRACARANIECGFIDAQTGRLILDACNDVYSGEYDEHFPVDMLHGGGYIGFNININEVLANVANRKAGQTHGRYEPVCPKQHVNLHQSTADSCATAARLAVIEKSESLCRSINRFNECVRLLKERYASTKTVARTCLMDAMPVFMGETFGAWSAFMKRRLSAFQSSVADLHGINLGGTVVGSGTGAEESYRSCVVDFLRESSGRKMFIRSNLYDAAQNIDDLGSVSSQLRLMSDGLLKIASDIRLLASGPHCGFGELKLPAVQEGSSFFPGKVNPVVPETVMQVCMQIAGYDRAVQGALEHGELNLNVFEGLALKNILDALRILDNAINLFTEKCIEGIEVNIERCEEHLSSLESNMWAAGATRTK